MAAKKGGLGKGLDSLIVNKNEGVVLANPEEHGAPVEVDSLTSFSLERILMMISYRNFLRILRFME